MTTVVEISDSEDADDCVITSVVHVVDDGPSCDLYNEVCKENQLLADFIEKCFEVENSISMQEVLKQTILKCYFEADKTAREAPRFQKNLRRAIYLVKTDAHHKFTHIHDLYNILRGIRAKKRVPFVTLTTNVSDNCQPNGVKRSMEQLDANSSSKKARLNVNIVAPFSETINNNLNHTDADSCHKNISMENASQQSSVAEDANHQSSVAEDASQQSSVAENASQQSSVAEDASQQSSVAEDASQQSSVAEKYMSLIPKKETPVFPTDTEKRIKLIENEIAYYKKTIAILDKQEVDDDSVNSPYIKSERLKAKIVSLYKERCQLIGSRLVKCKIIRLKLAEGHPPGPTKVLERFLNKNCNKDGEPPFPDFCDVITCVTEANDKDNLGWTKAQIMNEANALFTLCGRALQKRRQKREYRDLISKVKLEDFDKDPAEDDPQLQAKLEANKRIAVKKESEILKRYAMMQYLPSKSQKNTTTIENTGKEDTGETNVKNAQQELIHTNNNNYEAESVVPSKDEYEESNDGASLESNEKNIVIAPQSNPNVKSHKILKDCKLNMDIDNEENSTASTTNFLLQRVDTKIGALEHFSDVKDRYNKTIPNKSIRYVAEHIVKSVNKEYNEKHVRNNNCNNDLGTNDLNVIKNPMLHIESIESPLNEDALTNFKTLGDNFTLTVEIMSDS